MNSLEPLSIIPDRSWHIGTRTKNREPQLCSIIQVYFGASRVLGTVRNGQERSGPVRNGSERFLAPGLFAYCCPVLSFLSFQCEELFSRKHRRTTEQAWPVGKRVRKFSYQGTHAPWPPESKYKGGKHVTCCGMIVCRPSAPPLTWTCKMSGASSALRDQSHLQHLEHRAWCESPTERLWNISRCLGFHSLFLGVLCLWDARLWGKVSLRQHMLNPGWSYYIIGTATALRVKFPNIVSKICYIVSEIETYSFQDDWYRFHDWFWPTDKEATGHSNLSI